MDWCSDLSRRIAHTGTRGREEALPRSRRGSPSLEIQKGFPHSLGAGKTSCLKTLHERLEGQGIYLEVLYVDPLPAATDQCSQFLLVEHLEPLGGDELMDPPQEGGAGGSNDPVEAVVGTANVTGVHGGTPIRAGVQ